MTLILRVQLLKYHRPIKDNKGERTIMKAMEYSIHFHQKDFVYLLL